VQGACVRECAAILRDDPDHQVLLVFQEGEGCSFPNYADKSPPLPSAAATAVQGGRRRRGAPAAAATVCAFSRGYRGLGAAQQQSLPSCKRHTSVPLQGRRGVQTAAFAGVRGAGQTGRGQSPLALLAHALLSLPSSRHTHHHHHPVPPPGRAGGPPGRAASLFAHNRGGRWHLRAARPLARLATARARPADDPTTTRAAWHGSYSAAIG